MIIRTDKDCEIKIEENKLNLITTFNTRLREDIFYSLEDKLKIKQENENKVTSSQILTDEYDEVNAKNYNTLVINSLVDVEKDKTVSKLLINQIEELIQVDPKLSEIFLDYDANIYDFFDNIMFEDEIEMKVAEQSSITSLIKSVGFYFLQDSFAMTSYQEKKFLLSLYKKSQNKNRLIILNNYESDLGIIDKLKFLDDVNHIDSTVIIFTTDIQIILKGMEIGANVKIIDNVSNIYDNFDILGGIYDIVENKSEVLNKIIELTKVD